MAQPRLTRAQFAAFLESLEGAEIARISSIAFFALFVYEYFLTLDKEVKYFWSGKWNATRLLFLFNRYLPPMIMLLGLMCFFTPTPTDAFCAPAIRTSFISNIAAVGVIQAILVLRVWYLFQSTPWVQWATLVAFMASIVSSLGFSVLAAYDLKLLPTMKNVAGCRAARPDQFWRMFFPGLILHTLLYVLTAWRALKNRQSLKHAPVMKRLLWDGGFFFLVVFVSASFTAVGSFLTQYPKINIPIAFSNYLIAVTSIATSRVLFSIHSLADNLGSDIPWLFNNVELSRVDWRKGKGGEIIVERLTAEDDSYSDSDSMYKSKMDEEWGNIGGLKQTSFLIDPPTPSYSLNSDRGSPFGRGRTSPIKTTRIGVHHESNWI